MSSQALHFLAHQAAAGGGGRGVVGDVKQSNRVLFPFAGWCGGHNGGRRATHPPPTARVKTEGTSDDDERPPKDIQNGHDHSQ